MPLPARPHARRADVVLALVDLTAADDEVARAETVLSPAELARARRGSPAVHRRRVLLRAALRTAVAAELGTGPGDVPLGAGPRDRPWLPPSTGLDAGCAAAGSLGLVAVGRGCRLGVDVEAVAPWTPAVLAEGWLAPVEQQELAALPAGARALAATRAWTRKEAVLKGRGTGLGGGLAATVTGVGHPAVTVAGWWVRDVPMPDGWVASLATAPGGETPR
jgi:4'-phosphopantetheinyl transferase